MALAASSYIPTVAAALTRNRDQCSFPFNARPQAMTIYLRFVESGTINAANGTRVLEIASSADANPRLLIRTVGGNLYDAQWYDANGNVQDSPLLVAPVIGNQVELLATLTNAGVIQISQSINGAAATTAAASGARTLPQAWSGQTLWINSVGTSSVGFNSFRNVVIVAGVQTMQAMRLWAGVA